MSDYLWDRTGEPDEDVKRLEELLGGLAYEPRGLDLPRELEPPGRPRRALYSAALAAAASLILAAFIGGWLAFSPRRSSAPARVSVFSHVEGAGLAPAEKRKGNRQSALLGTSVDGVVARTQDPTPGTEHPSERLYRPAGVRRVRLKPTSRAGSIAPRAIVTGSNPGDDGELAAARQAKQQLILALQLASAKFNLAERKAPGIMTAGAGPAQQN